MPAFDVLKIFFNPVFICSIYVPIIVLVCYKFLKTRNASGPGDQWIRDIIDMPYFDVVIIHAIHLILFLSSYVIFVIQYLKMFFHATQKFHAIPTAFNYMFSDFWSATFNICVIIFIAAAPILILTGGFSKDRILEGYKERHETKKVYPPNNLLTWFRFIIAGLALGINVWENSLLK